MDIVALVIDEFHQVFRRGRHHDRGRFYLLHAPGMPKTTVEERQQQ
jgi:hypothetical protein